MYGNTLPCMWWTKGDVMYKRDYPCEFCDSEAAYEKKAVTVTRQRKGEWYIFEDVTSWVCPHCGHRYFDADVLEAMEQRMQSTPADARRISAWAISLMEAQATDDYDASGGVTRTESRIDWKVCTSVFPVESAE